MKPFTSPWRRLAIRAAALASALWLAACVGPALPPAQWWRLPAEATPPVAAAPASSTRVWQLVGAVSLPGHLERDALLVPDATGALQPRGAARWAEPLREAVPRLLRHDLSRALGAPVWTAPLPPGVAPTHQLRVELLALDVAPGARGVTVQARYSLTGPGLTPRTGELAFSQRAEGDGTASLVQAHRDAIATLARQLAGELR
jgi:hypothetical protein